MTMHRDLRVAWCTDRLIPQLITISAPCASARSSNWLSALRVALRPMGDGFLVQGAGQ